MIALITGFFVVVAILDKLWVVGVNALLYGLSELSKYLNAKLEARFRAGQPATQESPRAATVVASSQLIGDAASALVNLGVPPKPARAAVEAASRELGAQVTVEQLIQAGLKQLDRR